MMIDNAQFTPRQVTTPNDIQDEKSNIFIRTLFVGTRAIAYEVKCHDKSPNTDGRIELVDEESRPVGNIIVQAKTYKSEYQGEDKAEVPSYFVAYAERMRNEVCVFLSVDADSQIIYWKYISDAYIHDFRESGDCDSHIYHFSQEEIINKENVGTTIAKWNQIFAEKLSQLSTFKKTAEDVISENLLAFHVINSDLHHLKNSFIDRKEIGQLYDWIKNDLEENESNVKLLVGNAGMGKSVVVKQVVEKLEADGIKCFAIKADRFQFSSALSKNEQMELLTKTFSSLINEERVVLVIDQIDALSQYITNDRSKIENFIGLIRTFSSNSSLKNVRIIISCRSFDLEFDPILNILACEQQITLGPLSTQEVVKVLEKLRGGLSKEMDNKTILFLRTPQHLNIFCRVFEGTRKRDRQYISITELYDELWKQSINYAEGVNKEIAENVLYELAEKIFHDETLTPHLDYDSSSFKEANYLISQGLIEKTENGATFFHQSMYDYVFARLYSKKNRSIIKDLLEEKKHQGLFLRSTINMVLNYERTKNVKQYKEDIWTIFFSGKIRAHIQLMVLWEMSNKTIVLPFEKKCIRTLYSKNNLLFYSFISRTQCSEWYGVIMPLITEEIQTLKSDSPNYLDVLGYIRNQVHNDLEGVFKAIDSISDVNTRKDVAQRILYATSDYSKGIVTKWYDILCDTYSQKADFLERALPSNPTFVLNHISCLIAYSLDTKKNEEKDTSNFTRMICDDICKPLVENHSDVFYPILRNVVLSVINANRMSVSWREDVDYNNVFLSLMRHKHVYVYHEWLCEMLASRIKENPEYAKVDVVQFLNQKEESCYEIAFKAMCENPGLFSDEIVSILKNSSLVDELLTHCEDASYYFLEMVKKWLPTVDSSILETVQNTIYDFKSKSDKLIDKEKKYTYLYFPHMGYNQRKLIWAIPENLRCKQIKLRYQELSRKLGGKWKNEKPNHGAVMASVCGGLMSIEKYRTVSFRAWQNSFYGIKEYINGKQRHIDGRVHADIFKQCVSEQPELYANFVFSLFEDEKIPILYKLSGLDGLISVHYPLDKTLPYLWQSLDTIGSLFNDGYSYRVFDVIDNVVSIDGTHIDRITDYLKKVILSDYESKYDVSIEEHYSNNHITNDMLMIGINNHQGYAIHSLAKIGKYSQRRRLVYDFFIGIAEKLSLEHQLAAMYYLQQECYDNELYNKLMFRYASKPISDYLILNADRMHWFWCNDPDLILPYFSLVKNKRKAGPILAQIMFFGLQYDKSKSQSKVMFDEFISHNEEEVIEKIIPLAYNNLSDDTYGEQSEKLLRRFASDSRERVRDTLLFGCKEMPANKIYLFMDMLKEWIKTPIRDGLYDIVQYLEKTFHNYPNECYQCILLLMNSKSNMRYYEEEKILKVLLACYREFLDNEEIKKADEIMDVIDRMMIESYSQSMSKIMDDIANN